MALLTSAAIGLGELHIFISPCLTKPLNLLLSILQLHPVTLHDTVLLLQQIYGLFSFLGTRLLLCELGLHLEGSIALDLNTRYSMVRYYVVTINLYSAAQ